MGRWEPDARGRLERAAWELFQERGYARTTVEDIAARAGLTERTFFRHYADKREILFSGSELLEHAIVSSIAEGAAKATPFDLVAAAFEAAAAELQRHRAVEHVRARNELVMAHPELRERELIKMATLASAVSAALRARGVAELAASLAAEAGVAVFKVAFERWLSGAKPATFEAHVRAAAASLREVTAKPKSRA